MSKEPKALKKLRAKIDDIDSSIVDLLNKRASLSKDIGALKRVRKINIYAPDRESRVYESVLKKNKGPLNGNVIKAIYREIMSGTLALEGPARVAYLGPPATFTHQASLHKFGSSVDYIDCSTITEVFREVENGRADYGVVPIENSIEGAVNHTLDMFIHFDLKICSEVYLEINHNLLSRAGSVKKIKRVYSNPQVFGQCRGWIERNLPRAELIEVASTTKASEIASKERYAAAIGSILAADVYKLKALARSIEESAHNVTRFLVISKSLCPKPTRRDRTSVVFSVKDKVGALHDTLAPFKRDEVNLTKIESRPSKIKAWNYYFFVDMEGHLQDDKVKRAISGLKRRCNFVKVLGSYPVGR